MKVKVALALAVLFIAGMARADSVVDVDVVNVGLGGETLDMSFALDTTTSQIVPATTIITFGGPLSGTVWNFSSGACAFASCTPSSPANQFIWMDASGDSLEIGVYDLSIGSDCSGISPGTCPFPAVGTYPANIVDTDCVPFDTCYLGTGTGFSNGHGGDVIVMDPTGTSPMSAPEPSTSTTLAVGLIVLALARRKTYSAHDSHF